MNDGQQLKLVRYALLVDQRDAYGLSSIGFLGEATWEEKGTAGDHKGPPSRSPPPSPLRNDEHVSNKPTRVSALRDHAFKKPIRVRCLSYQRAMSNDILVYSGLELYIDNSIDKYTCQ